MGLGYLLYHLTQAAALALMVQGQTRSIFISRMVVVPFTLTIGMWITWHFGLYGAVFLICPGLRRNTCNAVRVSLTRESDGSEPAGAFPGSFGGSAC